MIDRVAGRPLTREGGGKQMLEPVQVDQGFLVEGLVVGAVPGTTVVVAVVEPARRNWVERRGDVGADGRFAIPIGIEALAGMERHDLTLEPRVLNHMAPEGVINVTLTRAGGSYAVGTMQRLAGGVALAESFDTVVKKALIADPRIQTAEWRRAQREQESALAWRPLVPQVNVNARVGQQNLDYVTKIAGTWNGRMTSGGLSASWRIFDSFVTQHQALAAKDREEGAGYDYLRAQDMGVLDIITAYVDLYRIQHLMRINQENRIAHRRISKIVQDRVHRGLAAPTRLSEALLRLRDLEQERDDLLVQQREAEEAYYLVIKERAQGKLGEVRSANSLPEFSQGRVQVMLDEAMRNNPLILATAKEIDALSQEVLATRREHGPSVSLVASHQNNTYDPQYPQGVANSNYAGVEVAWQIYGNMVDRRSAAAIARLEQMQAQHERQVRELTRNVHVAAENLLSMRSRIPQLESNAAVALQAAEQRESVFKTQSMGDDAVLSLSNAYYTAFRNEAALLNVRLRERLAQYTMLASLGRLRGEFGVSNRDYLAPPDEDFARAELNRAADRNWRENRLLEPSNPREKNMRDVSNPHENEPAGIPGSRENEPLDARNADIVHEENVRREVMRTERQDRPEREHYPLPERRLGEPVMPQTEETFPGPNPADDSAR